VAGRSPYIQSYTVHMYGNLWQGNHQKIRSYTVHMYGVLWQGNHQKYGHPRCICTVICGREITRNTVIHGAYVRCFVAGKSPNIRSYGVFRYAVFLYVRFWLTLVIHGAYVRFWPTLHMHHEQPMPKPQFASTQTPPVIKYKPIRLLVGKDQPDCPKVLSFGQPSPTRAAN
jgi:hypothetical protein